MDMVYVVLAQENNHDARRYFQWLQQRG